MHSQLRVINHYLCTVLNDAIFSITYSTNETNQQFFEILIAIYKFYAARDFHSPLIIITHLHLISPRSINCLQKNRRFHNFHFLWTFTAIRHRSLLRIRLWSHSSWIKSIRIRSSRISITSSYRWSDRSTLFSIRVYMFHRIVKTIIVSIERIKLFSRRIGHMPSPYRSIIHPRPVIIPIQSTFSIQFLTIILIRLYGKRWSKYTAERIVIVYFLYRSVLIDHYTVIPLMVLQKVMVCRVRESDVSILRQQLVKHSIFIDRIAAIVGGSSHSIYHVRCPELRSVRIIKIGNTVAISELYPIG